MNYAADFCGCDKCVHPVRLRLPHLNEGKLFRKALLVLCHPCGIFSRRDGIKNGTFFDCGGIEGVQYFCVMNMNDTLSSGTYFYRLETDMGILVKQMTIIK